MAPGRCPGAQVVLGVVCHVTNISEAPGHLKAEQTVCVSNSILQKAAPPQTQCQPKRILHASKKNQATQASNPCQCNKIKPRHTPHRLRVFRRIAILALLVAAIPAYAFMEPMARELVVAFVACLFDGGIWFC